MRNFATLLLILTSAVAGSAARADEGFRVQTDNGSIILVINNEKGLSCAPGNDLRVANFETSLDEKGGKKVDFVAWCEPTTHQQVSQK